MNDTSNRFMVRARDGVFYFDTPTTSPILVKLDRAGAINLAAWLQALADPGGEEIAQIVRQIEK
jgi:hypothetical protein